MTDSERVLLEQMKGYLQHKDTCDLNGRCHYMCDVQGQKLRCPMFAYSLNHERGAKVFDHDFKADCTCGLAALLRALPQTPEPTEQKEDARVDEQTVIPPERATAAFNQADPTPERSIKLLRDTLSMLCHFVWYRKMRPGDHMWSIPADRERDFDCILSDAIDELEQRRASPVLSSPSAAPQEQKIAERVRAILHERANDLTKQACDECEQCGPVVMCSYHSLLSELAGHVQLAAAPSGEAQKKLRQTAEWLISEVLTRHDMRGTDRDKKLVADIVERLAASQGVSAPAVAEIEQEMRSRQAMFMTAVQRHQIFKWADRLAALRGEQK